MEIYSVRAELDGSDALALALGEGWEPFAVLPYTFVSEWGNAEQTALVYLRYLSVV